MKKIIIALLMLFSIASFAQITGGHGFVVFDNLAALQASTLPTKTSKDISRHALVLSDSGEYILKGLNWYRQNPIYSATAPVAQIGNVVNTEAVWENPNISVVSGITVKYSYQGNEWRPQKGRITLKDIKGYNDAAFARLNALSVQNNGLIIIDTLITVSTQIVPFDNTKIIGENNGTIQCTNVSIAPIFINTNNIEISGLIIIGTNATGAIVSIANESGIAIRNANHIKISNCEIKRFRSKGIYLEHVKNYTIDNCIFFNNKQADIDDFSSASYSHYAIITRNKLFSNSRVGLSLGANGGLLEGIIANNISKPLNEDLTVIADNLVEKDHGFILHYAAPPSDTTRFVFSDNISHNSYGTGFYFTYCQNLNVVNCQSYRAGLRQLVSNGISAGMRFTNCSGTITNCIVQDYVGNLSNYHAGFGIGWGSDYPLINAHDSLATTLTFVNCVVKNATRAVYIGPNRMANTKFIGCTFSGYNNEAVTADGLNTLSQNSNVSFYMCDFFNTKITSTTCLNFRTAGTLNFKIENCNFISATKYAENKVLSWDDPNQASSTLASNITFKNNVIKNYNYGIWLNQYTDKRDALHFNIEENKFDNVDTAYYAFRASIGGTIAIGYKDKYVNVNQVIAKRVGTTHEMFVKGFVNNGQITAYTDGYLTGVPTLGFWNVGDEVINSTKSLTAPIKWICTVAGLPGTWAAITIPSTTAAIPQASATCTATTTQTLTMSQPIPAGTDVSRIMCWIESGGIRHQQFDLGIDPLGYTATFSGTALTLVFPTALAATDKIYVKVY